MRVFESERKRGLKKKRKNYGCNVKGNCAYTESVPTFNCEFMGTEK